MKEGPRPSMADLWKNFDLDATKAPAQPPAVAINTVHGHVLSIVTTQAVKISDLWEQACKQPAQR